MVPSVTTTVQTAQTASQNGTAVNTNGYEHLGVQLTGSFGGTAIFEASIDGTNWKSVLLKDVSSASLYSSASSAGIFVSDANCPVPALGSFRVRTANMVSGNVTATVLLAGPAELQ